MQVHIYL